METKIQTNNDSRATLEADFADANKNIPQSLFTENLTSMYENVLLWCRDYLYNGQSANPNGIKYSQSDKQFTAVSGGAMQYEFPISINEMIELGLIKEIEL